MGGGEEAGMGGGEEAGMGGGEEGWDEWRGGRLG